MRDQCIPPQTDMLTAAQVARHLYKLGFNWLDIEFILDLAPGERLNGHTHYCPARIQKFVGRAFWMNEQPIDFRGAVAPERQEAA